MAKSKNTFRSVLLVIVILALLASVVTLFVMLDRQTSTTVIGGEAYSIGTLNDSGEAVEGDASIYLRKAVTVDGLKVEIAKDANVTYKLYFFDQNGKFVSATSEQTANFDGVIPENAASVRVLITPIEDEDGKVSLIEVLGYAKQVTVTVNK